MEPDWPNSPASSIALVTEASTLRTASSVRPTRLRSSLTTTGPPIATTDAIKATAASVPPRLNPSLPLPIDVFVCMPL